MNYKLILIAIAGLLYIGQNTCVLSPGLLQNFQLSYNCAKLNYYNYMDSSRVFSYNISSEYKNEILNCYKHIPTFFQYECLPKTMTLFDYILAGINRNLFSDSFNLIIYN